MAQGGNLVFPRNDSLAVRIVCHSVLFMAVARIAYRKMRSGLFRYQNRQLVVDVEAACSHIRCGIRADGKFAQRQSIMMEQHVILQKLFVFLFVCEVFAVIAADAAILKMQLQIVILHPIQIYLRHMQHALCSGKLRRCEHLSHRNIHVCHTVFKIRLLCRIGERMEHYLHISTIFISAFDPYPFRLVQRVDDTLLNRLVRLIIQRIYLQYLIENRFKILSYLRYGERNDRKASLFRIDIFVRHRSRLALIFHRKLLLLFGKLQSLRLVFRLKGLFSKRFYHRRSRMKSRLVLILFPCRLPAFQHPGHIFFVKIQRLIVFMVIIELTVHRRSEIP